MIPTSVLSATPPHSQCCHLAKKNVLNQVLPSPLHFRGGHTA
jgi:hypothetical protein